MDGANLSLGDLHFSQGDGEITFCGAIDYLTRFGYSPEQAYLLLGAAPIEGRLSGVVDIPNSCSTVYIPTAIFDFDVQPSADGPFRIDPGIGAQRAANR